MLLYHGRQHRACRWHETVHTCPLPILERTNHGTHRGLRLHPLRTSNMVVLQELQGYSSYAEKEMGVLHGNGIEGQYFVFSHVCLYASALRTAIDTFSSTA
jgi:hypothetical protein